MFDWIEISLGDISYKLLATVGVGFIAVLIAQLTQVIRLKKMIKTKKDRLNRKLDQAQKLHRALHAQRAELEKLGKIEVIKHRAIHQKILRVVELEEAIILAGSVSSKLFEKNYITTTPNLVRSLLELKATRDLEKRKTNTIVGMMLEEKLTKSKKNSSFLIIALLAYIGCSSFNLIPLNPFAIIIPLVLLTAFYLDQYLIIYRVRKGWYGRNEYETREIISYIVAHADKDDFNDDGGLKKLMDAPENAKNSVQNEKGWVKA
ncbi:hypothetical protein KW526_06845 [Vibrio fluvialis]|nr:hypothetical protein [Vibrio fluvialis]